MTQIIEKEKNYVAVANISDVAQGTMKNVKVNNRDILIANIEGRFYAMDDRCGHMNALLSMGELKGKNVVCPFHFAQFDVTTGKKVRDPVPESLKDMEKLPKKMQQFLIYAKKLIDPVKTYDIQTYEVKIEKGTIFIQI